MSKVIDIDIKTAKELIQELENFEKVKRQILRLLPDELITHGSNMWWEKEVLQGEEEMKKSAYKTYDNPQSLLSDLHFGE